MPNDTEQLQLHNNPYGAVVEVHSAAKRDYEYITPMRLLDLLWKSKRGHHDLTGSERATLSAVVTYVYRDGVETNAIYEAWPTIEMIMERSNFGRSTVESARRTLEEKNWITVVAGRREGQANHYFINGHKIVAAYNSSNPEQTVVMKVDNFNTVESSRSTHVRDKSGLKQEQPLGRQSAT